MTIEVYVLNGIDSAPKVFAFADVGDIITDSESKILSIEDEDGNTLAEFRHWMYWRKTSD